MWFRIVFQYLSNGVGIITQFCFWDYNNIISEVKLHNIHTIGMTRKFCENKLWKCYKWTSSTELSTFYVVYNLKVRIKFARNRLKCRINCAPYFSIEYLKMLTILCSDYRLRLFFMSHNFWDLCNDLSTISQLCFQYFKMSIEYSIISSMCRYNVPKKS